MLIRKRNPNALIDGTPYHPFIYHHGDHPGYLASHHVHRNYSAVTGACLMTRREVFDAVGGFDERFSLCYNDVDYCLKVSELGKRVVYTPYSKLYHHESVSKAGTDLAELEFFKKTWADRIPRDPYYNQNLSVDAEDFGLRL